MIILNDKRYAFEMLDKRASKYSDRATMVFAGELYVCLPILMLLYSIILTTYERCGWNGTMVMQHHDDNFRAYRKCIHQGIGTPAAVTRHRKLIEIESQRFLLRVLRSPKDVLKHLRKYDSFFPFLSVY